MEAVYHLYCDEQISLKLASSISHLEGLYNVKITYNPGQYAIFRNLAAVFQHQQAKHALINLIKRGSAVYQWFWWNQQRFIPYDPASNYFIEEAYTNKTPDLALNINNRIYRIDFLEFSQKSISGVVPRPICRIPPVETPKRHHFSDSWSYTYDNWKRPKIFPNVVIKVLRNAAESNKNVEISLKNVSYKVDIAAMKMTDSSNRVYTIIRTSN
jgi:WWE domain